jgi:hypothetical protein
MWGDGSAERIDYTTQTAILACCFSSSVEGVQTAFLEVKSSLDWKTVRNAEATLWLTKPVLYIPNPSIRSAVHCSMFDQPCVSETLAVVKHLVMYNPDFTGVDRSLVHELSHAKTDEVGYYCFPTLQGGEAAAYEMSWSWIDDAYAHMTLYSYWKQALLLELSAKITGMAEHITMGLLDPHLMQGDGGLRWLIRELLRTALYEALVPKFKFTQLHSELEAAKDSWSTIRKSVPGLWEFQKQAFSVFSNLPSQENLTKEKYIEAGLELAFSEHVSAPARVAMRYDKQYRERLQSIVKPLSA